MRPRWRWARATLWAALGLTLGLGCELIVSLDHLDNGMCGANEKLCDGHCFSFTDKRTGCGSTNCSPCILDHAIARCDDSFKCAISSCIDDWTDCDHTPENGCELDLAHNPDYCGSCTQTNCSSLNAFADCFARQCAIGGCYPGYGDCDNDQKTGCETSIWADERCGDSCSSPACPGGQHCNKGTCM